MSDARIVIGADGSQAMAELERLKGAFSNSMTSIKASAALATTAVGFLAAGGIALSFANSIKEAIDMADHLNKLSQRTGVATESLSQLQYAAKLADVSNESLTTGLKKLNVSIANGIAGDKEKVAVFQALGITLTDTAGRTKSADKVLMDIANTFAISKDGAGKTAAAVALLGKAGDEMIPLLNGGAQAIRDLMKEADKLGLTISSDFAERAEVFNDNLTRVKVSSQKLAISLASDLVDGLGRAVKAMADATIEGGKLAGVLAGLKTLFAGDAQHQNNVALVEDADRKFALEAGLAKLKAAGYTADTLAFKSQIKQLDQVNARLASTMDVRKKLQADEDKAKAAADAVKKIKTDGPEIKIPDKSGDAKEKESEYAKLNKLIQEKIDLDTQSLELGRDLTEAEKFSIKITNDMNLAKVGLTRTERSLIETKLKAQQVLAKEAAWQKHANEENKKYYEALDQTTKSLRDEVKAQQEATDKAGLHARELQNLEQAKVKNLVADKLMRASVADVIDITGQEGDVLREQARLLQKNGTLKASAFDKTIAASMRDSLKDLVDETAALSMTNAQRETAIKLREAEKLGLDKASVAYSEYAAQITAAVVKKETTDDGIKQQVGMWQTIEGAAKDTFLSIFNSGKSAFTRLKDTLKNGLYALLYEMTVKKWVISLTTGVSGAAVAQQAHGLASGGGGLASLSNLSSVANLLGAGSTAGASLASLGAANAVGAVGGDALGTLIAANGSWAGVAAGATEAAAAGTAALGSIGGITSALAAIPGWGWAIAGGLALAGMLSKKGIASQSTGSLSRIYDGSGNVTSSASNFGEGNAGGTLDGLQAGYASLRDAMGAKGGAAFAYGAYSGNDNKNPMARIQGNGFDSGEFAQNDANMQLAASRVIFAALKSSELPRELSGLFNGLDVNKITQKQIDDVYTYGQALKSLDANLQAMPFDGLKNQSYDAVQAMIAMSGGIQQFTTNLSTYYDNFYTAEEKRNRTVAQITEKLNAAGGNFTATQVSGASREDFRKAFEAATSPELKGALLAVAGAFAGIVPVTVAATTAVADNTAATKAQASVEQTLAASRAAALQLVTTAVNDAFNQVVKAADAQKNALAATFQDLTTSINTQLATVGNSIGKLQSLSSTLQSSLSGLQISGGQGQARADAQSTITAILETAKSGGGLPVNSQALTAALSTVAKPSEQLFASFTDYAKDFYRTANDISYLSKITDKGLSEQQDIEFSLRAQLIIAKASYDSQISQINATQAAAQAQLDAFNGNTGAILSLTAAMALFAAALGSANSVKSNQQKLIEASRPENGHGGAAYELGATERGQIGDILNRMVATTGVTQDMALYLLAKDRGYSASEVDTYMGFAAGTAASYIQATNLPKLVAGTNYAPNDVVAQKAIEASTTAINYPKVAAYELGSVERGQIGDILNQTSASTGVTQDMALYQMAKDRGYSASEVDTFMGFAAGTAASYVQANNLPKLATGTNYVPEDGAYYLHQGEAVQPKQYNPAAGGSGDSEGLKNEIKAMRSDMNAALLKIAQNTGKTAKLNDRWESDGLPATRTTT